MTPNNQSTGVSATMDKIVLGFGRFLSWANGILVLVIVLQATSEAVSERDLEHDHQNKEAIGPA